MLRTSAQPRSPPSSSTRAPTTQPPSPPPTPAGTYASSAAPQCTQASAGWRTNILQTDQQICPGGTFSPPGADQCQACATTVDQISAVSLPQKSIKHRQFQPPPTPFPTVANFPSPEASLAHSPALATAPMTTKHPSAHAQSAPTTTTPPPTFPSMLNALPAR